MAQLCTTINSMIDRCVFPMIVSLDCSNACPTFCRLGIFAAEVTRVAREVGTKGNLGVTAEVDNIDGTWQEITSNVNTMVNGPNNLLAVYTGSRFDLYRLPTLRLKSERSLRFQQQRQLATSAHSSPSRLAEKWTL
jgi:hypothetical protein